VSTVRELLERYQHVLDSVTVVTGAKGVFDVEVDGELLYSKHATGRHARPGEVLALFADRYAQGVTPYGE
jgi:predicted Rdx family selenoprotein